MKFSASAFNWTRNFGVADFPILRACREHGLAGFEVAIFDPVAVDAGAIRRELEANQLDCTVCAILPAGVNPISEDPVARSRSQAHLARCIEVAAAMGAKLIGGPVYAPIGYLPGRLRNREEWAWAIEYFQKAGSLLDEYEMTLAIEPVNRGETFFLTTAAEAALLCEQIGHPRVGVLVDTFHANIEEKNIAKTLLALGSRLKHIHVSENDRGVPGTGSVDFSAMLGALRSIAYNGYLVVEGLGFVPPEKNTQNFMWRRPRETPEEIVFGGLEYLRSLA